jgi:hypothetical protein
MIPRKRIWKKSNKEQKEVLQALQSDIRAIKESLQEIKDVMEGTKFFSGFFNLGSILIAIGTAVMFMGLSLMYTPDMRIHFSVVIVSGFLMFCSGAFMIGGASNAGTDVNKYPDKLGIKTLNKLRRNNKQLFRAILLLIILLLVFAVLVPYTYIVILTPLFVLP